MLGAIQFLEAFLAEAVGKIIGVPLVVGIIGNWTSVMLIFMYARKKVFIHLPQHNFEMKH